MTLRILFISFFFLFVQILNAQKELNQKIDFFATNIPIEKALTQLAEQTNLNIAFSKRFFQTSDPITANYNNQSIEWILNELLHNTGIDFKNRNGRILLFPAKKQTFTISGYIEDKDTGERLISATVYCSTHQKGTYTNEYGFYSLSLPKGVINLEFSYLGCESLSKTINLSNNISENIQLSNALTLAEVIVEDEEKNTLFLKQNAQQSAQRLSNELVRISPSLGGEADPIRTAQLLPGIQSGVDGLGGIFVRGGNSGHNLMLLDGVTVYIPYHLMGAFSIYNQHTIRSANIYKGNFPARYGGRLASVFDIRTREGNQYRWTGHLGMNLVSANALIEGPIQKEKGAILLAGRSSHTGLFLNPFFKRTYFSNNTEEITTSFQDFNAKINYTLSQKDRVYLSFYRGADFMESSIESEELDEEEEEEFSIEEDVILNWSNTIFSLRWNHLFSDKLFSNTTLTYSLFDYEYTVLEELRGELDQFGDFPLEDIFYLSNQSQNEDIGLKIDLDYLPNPIHRFRFGGGFSFRSFIPKIVYRDIEDEAIGDDDDYTISELQALEEEVEIEAIESYLYVEDQINIKDKWHFNLGLRLSNFFQEEQQDYTLLEPRLSIHYQANKKVRFHTSINRMVQYLHLVSNNTVRLPNDLWIPSNNDLLPETAWQVELGMHYQIRPSLQLKIDAYAKQMQHLYSYPQDFSFEEEDFNIFLVEGSGEARGIELSLQQEGKRNGGFLSYARTSSTRTFSSINDGNPFPHANDQPHQIKLFLYQKWGKGFTAGLNWVFNSPNPRQLIRPLGPEQIETPTNINENNALRNEAVYHRLDLNLSYQYRTKKLSHLFKIGAYNVYNRQNIAYYRLDFDINGNEAYLPVYGLSFRPSFSYTLRFQ